jgi:leucyl/phenylalanyl-tRNA--protein transferase
VAAAAAAPAPAAAAAAGGGPDRAASLAVELTSLLLAAGADLSPQRLIDAYRHGIFPWFSDGQPILWWSPDPRMVLAPAEVRVTRSLAKVMRNGGFSARADSAFRRVMQACAEPRDGQDGTWITGDMIDAYCALHARGIAHSIEVWRDGELAGGLYGVALGRMFYGESMFSRARDASKIALVELARHLARHHFGLIDCQMHTAHLATMGAREMPRPAFMRKLAELVNYPQKPGPWILYDDADAEQ